MNAYYSRKQPSHDNAQPTEGVQRQRSTKQLQQVDRQRSLTLGKETSETLIGDRRMKAQFVKRQSPEARPPGGQQTVDSGIPRQAGQVRMKQSIGQNRNRNNNLDAQNEYSTSAASGRPNDYKPAGGGNSPVKKVHRVDLKGKGIHRSDSGGFEGRNRMPLAEQSHSRQVTIEHSGQRLMEPTSKQSEARPRQNSFIRELSANDTKFSGISGLSRKKTNHNAEFMQRFQDKQSFMNKDGHMGIVANAQQPIVRRVDRVELSQQLVKSTAKQSKVHTLEPTSGLKNSQTPLHNNNRDHFAQPATMEPNSRFSVTPSHNHIAKPPHAPVNDFSRMDSGVSYESSPAKHYSRKVRENSPTFGGMQPLSGADVMPMSELMLSKGSDNQRWRDKRNSDPTNFSPSAQAAQNRFKQNGISQQSIDVSSTHGGKAASKVERRSPLNGLPKESSTSIKKAAKSAQRSTNFIRAGNSISSNMDSAMKLSSSNTRLQQFQRQQSPPDPNITEFFPMSNAQPTQYSDSRHLQANSRGQGGIGVGLVAGGPVNMQTISSNIGSQLQPIGSGLSQDFPNVGYFGRIDVANSDAPSSSFYSNNTSVVSTQGLNNSRYHAGGGKERVPPMASVGKVIPQVNKSSETAIPHGGAGARVNQINRMNQSIGSYSLAAGHVSSNSSQFQAGYQKPPRQSMQPNTSQYAPVQPSANYERVQAKYGVRPGADYSRMSSQQTANSSGAIDGFNEVPQYTPYHRPQAADSLDVSGIPPHNSSVPSKYAEMIMRKQAVANFVNS